MGRPIGQPNLLTRSLKSMIMQALREEGGLEYLRQQARDEPKAFLALLGKLIPKKLNVDGNVTHTLESLILGDQPQVEDERETPPSH